MADGNPKVTYDDVLDLNEMFIVDAINQDRARKEADRKAKKRK